LRRNAKGEGGKGQRFEWAFRAAETRRGVTGSSTRIGISAVQPRAPAPRHASFSAHPDNGPALPHGAQVIAWFAMGVPGMKSWRVLRWLPAGQVCRSGTTARSSPEQDARGRPSRARRVFVCSCPPVGAGDSMPQSSIAPRTPSVTSAVTFHSKGMEISSSG
jgi:hypothetical protein